MTWGTLFIWTLCILNEEKQSEPKSAVFPIIIITVFFVEIAQNPSEKIDTSDDLVESSMAQSFLTLHFWQTVLIKNIYIFLFPPSSKPGHI